MKKSTMDLIATIRPRIVAHSHDVVPQQDRDELLNSILGTGIVDRRKHTPVYRRPVVIGAVAVGAAAVVMATIAVIPSGGAPTGQVHDAAYLVDRLAQALGNSDAVVHFRESVTGGGTSYVDEHWYRLASGLGRMTTARADGTLCTDATITGLSPLPRDPNGPYMVIAASSVVTGVNYANHTWWTHPGKPWDLNAPDCAVSGPDDLAGYSQLIDIALNVEQIKQDLTNGELRVVRTGEVVNGQRTVELNDGSGAVSSRNTEIWINDTTYQPVRSIVTAKDGTRRQTDYEFLPPTAANLADLRTSVPSGFRQVSPPVHY